MVQFYKLQDQGEKERFIVVIGIPPMKLALDALEASIVPDAKRRKTP